MHVVISVMARDRVGIVASVSGAVFDLEGNIDAMSQTVLRGYFALILTAAFPRPLPLGEIRRHIEEAGRENELEVSVQERNPEAESLPVVAEGEPFVMTLSVRDRTGIVSVVSAYLAGRNINITDLYAFTRGDRFILIGQMLVPGGLDIRGLQTGLKEMWKDREATVTLQHENLFVATNEVHFRHGRPAAGCSP